MGKIKKILENELVGGTQTTDVYPVTSTKAVYDENNESLDKILSASDDKLTELDGKIGEILNISESGMASYPYEIIGGRTYKIINNMPNSAVLAVRQTPDGESSDVVTLLANSTLVYTPQNSGHYLYHNTTIDLTITEMSSLVYKIEDMGTSIDAINDELGDYLSESSGTEVGSMFFNFPLKKDTTYTIKNIGTNGTINIMSASEASSGHVVETFKYGLAIGTSYDFTPSIDAPYLQIYFAAIGAFEIGEKNGLLLRTKTIENKIENAENNISSLTSSLQGVVRQDDIKALIVNNKLNYSVLHGNVVNAADGSLAPSTGISYVIIDISELNLLKISYKQTTFGGNYGYGFFTSDNQWVGGVHTTSVQDVEIEVPVNAREFRCCWNPGLISDTDQLISGSSIVNLEDIKSESLKNNLHYPFYPDFDLSKTPSQTTEEYTSDINNFYSMYDSLVSAYPNWVSKIDCDAEVGLTKPDYLKELPIYMYKFSPKRTSTSVDSSNRIKMLIVSGLHSNEVMGMYLLNRFFKMLGNNWKNDKNVEQMRTLIDFYVIPCLNPWGFVNRANVGEGGVRIPGRANGNGVNLNRNFPTGDWILQGTPTDADSNYSGASAGSEYETKILMHYVNTIKPDACFDVHTGGMTSNGAYGSVEIHDGADWRLVSMLIGMCRAICNQWVKENSNFPQDIEDSSRLFDVNLSSVTGEFHRWAYEQGVNLSILTEESIFQNWVDGILQSTNQEYNTDMIWRENLKSLYNTIMRLAYSASVSKNLINRNI